jgi:hypothetical protein
MLYCMRKPIFQSPFRSRIRLPNLGWLPAQNVEYSVPCIRPGILAC